MSSGVQWPDGKRFAFTVFDDPDGSSEASRMVLNRCAMMSTVLSTTSFLSAAWIAASLSPSSATGATPSAEAADARTARTRKATTALMEPLSVPHVNTQRKGATIPTAPAHLLIPPRQHRVVAVLRGC